MRMGAARDLRYSSFALEDIRFELVEGRGTAGEVAERMAAEFVAFPEKRVEIRSTELRAEAVGLAHQPHGSVESPAHPVVLQDSAADAKCRLREVVKRKRHDRASIRERQITPVDGTNRTPSDATKEMAKGHVPGNAPLRSLRVLPAQGSLPRLPPGERIQQPTQFVGPAFVIDGQAAGGDRRPRPEEVGQFNQILDRPFPTLNIPPHDL